MIDIYKMSITLKCWRQVNRGKEATHKIDNTWYALSRTDREELMNSKKGLHTIEEYPQKCSMLRFMCHEEDVEELTGTIQAFLTSRKAAVEYLDCAVIRGGGNERYLRFPNTFLMEDDYRLLCQHLRYDEKACRKPATMIDTEEVVTVIRGDGTLETPDSYFQTYQLFGCDERPIAIDGPLEQYYKRIFSIVPYGRGVEGPFLS
jgi:hypothetical protein